MPTPSSGLPRPIELALTVAIASLTLPLLFAACVAIVLVDGWPILHWQLREGRDGRAYRMPKLRSMRRDAEDALAQLLASDPQVAAEWQRFRRLERDPRLLPFVGRFLRRMSLDELPQLWNVWRGEMHLVGPRPLEIEVAAALPAELRARRTAVAPGLTGLWQVSGRSTLSIEQMVVLDREYLATRSPRRDLQILLQTPAAVLRGVGAY